MKYVLFLLGGFITLWGFYTLQKYAFDYAILSEYGHGYVWGGLIRFAIGIGLVFWGYRLHKRENTEIES